MRILHVSEAWNGGVSTIINTLCRHQAKDHDVAIAYSPAAAKFNFDGALYKKLGVQTFSYESSRNPLKILNCAFQIRDIVKTYKPDIIHLHSSFAGLYGRIFPCDVPIVYCPHGWSFTEESGAVKRKVYGWIERALSQRTDAIIEISEREYQSALSYHIDPPIHRVVLNGVDNATKKPQPIPFKTDDRKINLAFIGRLDHKKGSDLLYQYFKNRKLDHVTLSVIGEASRSRANTFNDKTSAITFLGWVDADLMDSYIRQFDAIIVPSRFEAFGLVVLEAMRNGVPAIVARDTAMPEIVTHGHNGLVFDIRDFEPEMDEILAGLDKIRLAEMGRNARHVYQERFTAKRMADEVMVVYRDALKSA